MEGYTNLDLSAVMQRVMSGGDPGIKMALGINAMKQARIFEAEIAIILGTALREYQKSIFVDVTA